MALLTASLEGDTFSNSDSLNQAKYDVLSKVYPPFKESAYIGQYIGYQEHVCQTSSDCTKTSTMPTLASVVLYIKDGRWALVPFILISGKMMQKREAYVRVVFTKPAKFKPYLHVPDTGAESCSEEIIFSIHDEVGESCHIYVPSNNGYQSPFTGGRMELVTANSCNYLIEKFSPSEDATALHPYASVLKGILEGRKDESWRVWSPLLSELEREKGQNLWLYQEDMWKMLSLAVSGTDISQSSSPIEKMSVMKSKSIQYATNATNTFPYFNQSMSFLDASFKKQLSGHQVKVLSWSSLSLSVAQDIYNIALESVSKRGVFHLALPGGSSPLGVFQALVLNYGQAFPWANTHIWQTDERCVPLTSPDSNLNRMSIDLLNFIPIPVTNIHPLIDLMFTPCIGKDTADARTVLDDYWNQLVHNTGLNRLDYVLLGVGSDGHVASIFPSKASNYNEVGSNLTVTQISDDYPIYIKHRVSVTIETVVSAHHIGLVVVGDKKCNIVRHEDSTTPFYDIINLAQKDNLKIFIDDVCII